MYLTQSNVIRGLSKQEKKIAMSARKMKITDYYRLVFLNRY